MFNFSSHSAKSKYYYDSRKLVADKLKNVTRSAAIDELVGLKPKMHFFGK